MQPGTGSRISFAFFWSKALFHVKYTTQAFPLSSVQLHAEGKEVAFLPQSSSDMATPVGTGASGLLRKYSGKAVRKGGLGLSQAYWSVCVKR